MGTLVRTIGGRSLRLRFRGVGACLLVGVGFAASCGAAVALPPLGQTEEWPVPTGARIGQGEIAAGPEGVAWALQGVDYYEDYGWVERTTGPGQDSQMNLGLDARGADIVTGPDRNMWITEPHDAGYEQEQHPDAMGRLVASDGEWHLTEFPITPTELSAGCCFGPLGVASGPRGHLWFTDTRPNALHQTFIGEMATDENPDRARAPCRQR